MPRFTSDNTEGYDTADLLILNKRFDEIMAETAANAEDCGIRHYADHVAEALLADFDAEMHRLTHETA